MTRGRKTESNALGTRQTSGTRGMCFALQLACLVALIVPSLAAAANTGPLGAPGTITLPVAEQAPTEAEEYAKEFSVSKEVAENRLTLQEQGAGIVGQLKAAQGSDYAGVWFDNTSGEFVVPLLEKAKAPSIRQVLADDELASAYRTEPAEFSWKELESAQARVNSILSTVEPTNSVKTWLDPRVDAVIVTEALEVDEQDRARLQSIAAENPGEVDITDTATSAHQSGTQACTAKEYRCDPPMRGGVRINAAGNDDNSYICTAGFNATGNVQANEFVLTAGHCVSYGGPKEWEALLGSSLTNRYLGHVEGWAFPEWDFAEINATGAWWGERGWPDIVANWGESQEWAIEHEAWTFVGEFVCKVGGNTGKSCGTVNGLNGVLSAENIEPGFHVYHVAQVTGLCSNEGDSGGPVFAGHTGLGLFSGDEPLGSEEEHCNVLGYYTELPAATTALGVTVASRLGGAPTAVAEPAGSIHSHEATLHGTVNPDSVPTTYQFQYGLTTSYGGSLPVPAGEVGYGSSGVPVSGGVTGLSAATTYHYRVVATSNAGTVPSADAQFTTAPAPPIVSTGAATEVAHGEATLRGTVNPQGASTTYWFEWGTTTAYGHEAPLSHVSAGAGTATEPAAAIIGGIRGETIYHYRLVAVNSEGVSYGNDNQFTTPSWRPHVVAEAAVEAGLHKYTFHGELNPEGCATHYRYEWGTSESYGSNVEVPEELTGASNIPVSRLIEGLEEETTYYFRIVATSIEGVGEAKGSFTTPAWRPSVAVEAPDERTETEVTLHGTVNPHGRASTYWFEYGETAAYGHKAPEPAGSAGSGTMPTAAQVVLTGLKAKTTYHYRLVAENEAGVRYGGDQVVATTDGKPFVATEGATVIQSIEPTDEAVLHGKVDPDAKATNYYFAYGPTEALGSKAPASPGSAGSGKVYKAVEATAAGLKHHATFFYRLMAENEKGLPDEEEKPKSASTSVTPEWVIQSPVNYKSNSRLNSVSCATEGHCVAVGEYTASGKVWPLAERESLKAGATEWHAEGLPGEVGELGGTLEGVACAGAEGKCFAVGHTVAKTKLHTATSLWNGSEWSEVPAPNPGLGGALTSVSCMSPTNCVGVGYYEETGGVKKTLAVRWNGTKWTSETTLNIGGSTDSQLQSVACSEHYVSLLLWRECLAVGYALTPVGGVKEAIAERWTGTSWSGLSVPGPEGAAADALLGVSCGTLGECEGVGYYEVSGHKHALVEGWGGYFTPSWSLQASPSRPNASTSTFNSVACAPVEGRTCEAMGEVELTSGKKRAMAARYTTAGGWVTQYTPSSGEEETPTFLAGGACPITAECLAVGRSEATVGTPAAFGELFK